MKQPHTSVNVFRYEDATNVSEYHAVLYVTNPRLMFTEQVDFLFKAYNQLLHELEGAVPVFKRFFLSDAANQSEYLWNKLKENPECAVSVIEQPPLNGTKIALWVYFQKGVQTKFLSNGMFEVSHGDYRHLWVGSACNEESGSEEQSQSLLSEYIERLSEEGCSLAQHCIRTWFFVQNVDVNYAGFVKARNDVFASQGLTAHTHFIASTGIAGRHASSRVLIQMDAYAIDGIKPEQVHHLYARTHLNPTHEYGVSFERGTYVDYGDRRHVFISGTASINNQGEIVFPKDVRKQTLRMWENVEMLLKEADCTFDQVGHLLVYLRDVADYEIVREMFEKRFPEIPKIFLWAPVCRPGWLIEMECMAIKTIHDERYSSF